MALTEVFKVRLPAGTGDALRAAGAPYAVTAADMVREGVANVLAGEGRALPPELDAVRPDLPRLRGEAMAATGAGMIEAA